MMANESDKCMTVTANNFEVVILISVLVVIAFINLVWRIYSNHRHNLKKRYIL